MQRWLKRALGPVSEKQRASLARASEIACRCGRNAHPGRPAMRATGQLARRRARSSHERTPPSPRTPESSLEPFLHAARGPLDTETRAASPDEGHRRTRELARAVSARLPGPARGGNARRITRRMALRDPRARSGHLCTPGGSLGHLISAQRWLERALGPILEKQRAGLARASGIACRSGRNAHRRRRGMRTTGQLARRGARSRHERTSPSARTPGNSLEPIPHTT